jgi:peptidoglycan/xylan/chitin deacetylase (PgdA/CDA1 family)
VDRRTLLTRLGLGGALVAAPAAGAAVGYRLGIDQLSGTTMASVRAGEGRGTATIWWSRTTERRRLALTFDDGPTSRFTPTVLDILERYSVPATFFLIGELVQRDPELVRRTIEAGHEVANHTFDHISAALQEPDEVRRTVERGADAVASVLGDRPRWFRPVRGHITGSLLTAVNELGHDLAMWSVGRGPAESVADDDVDGVREHMTASVHPGAIVILHDGIGRSAFEWSGPDEQLVTQRATELEALPAVVERYLAEGYEFVTVSDLIDLPAPG